MYSQHVYLKICCRISLNIEVNMVVVLQPKFHPKQVIDKFVNWDRADNTILTLKAFLQSLCPFRISTKVRKYFYTYLFHSKFFW